MQVGEQPVLLAKQAAIETWREVPIVSSQGPQRTWISDGVTSLFCVHAGRTSRAPKSRARERRRIRYLRISMPEMLALSVTVVNCTVMVPDEVEVAVNSRTTALYWAPAVL